MTPVFDRYSQIIRHAVISALNEQKELTTPAYFDEAAEIFRTSDREDQEIDREVFELLGFQLSFLRGAEFGKEISQPDWELLICSVGGVIAELRKLVITHGHFAL